MSRPAFLEQPSYQLFRRAFAEKKAPLIIICGSGLSAPAHLPTWPSLRRNLQEDLTRLDRSLGAIGAQMTEGRVDFIKKQDDMWIAFKLLKEALTPPTYDRLVEQYLSPVQDAPLPAGYLDILKLSPRGLVTLNLDKFAGEAFAQANPSNLVTPIYGSELAQKWNQLSTSRSFLVYLHGGLHDPSTWVLTQDELKNLTSSVGHQHFIRYLFTEHLVLFVGMSADDQAISGRLLELTEAGFRPRNLYWFTSRNDAGVHRFASSGYVSIIKYSARSHEEHSQAIHGLVADCLVFKSVDSKEPPKQLSENQLERVPETTESDPEEMAQLPPEEIRWLIAKQLDYELRRANGEQAAFDIYRIFCKKYDYAVHRAFYRGAQEKYRRWFGYVLEMPPLGRGNFGEVYSAADKDGNIVAVKVMHESIFGNDDMLGGFRRGVRSMQYVTQSKVQGMVPLIESYELPPTIIMPYVAGHSLQEVFMIRPDLDWRLRLEIGIQIGVIVGRAHSLPETILHRDLKPSNIMVSNLEYEGTFTPEIIVLDFDMSWHKGSKEKDVVFESRDDFGFLAPEQTDANNRYAARSTRVDSYGLGMTLFYIFGQDAPRPNEALSDLWIGRAIKAAERGYKDKWKSAPSRMGRLIARLTEIDQNMRTDFATATHALENIALALDDPKVMYNPELWAEEVLFHAISGSKYHWDDAVGRGTYESPTGLTVSVFSNYRNSSVNFEINYVDRGVKERAQLLKILPNAVASAQRELRSGGWQIIDSRSGGGNAFIRAEVSVANLQLSQVIALMAGQSALKHFQI